MNWDLITVGGGAAGFFGAIIHAEQGGGTTLILEKTSQFLGKVKISGGGRCNVTHHCFDPIDFSSHYPRGEKALIGPLHRWNAEDTVQWFASKGVSLKTEPDGRMFPISNDSQTIIDCLTKVARELGITVSTRAGVRQIVPHEKGPCRFTVEIESGKLFQTRALLLATGGTRLAAGARLVEQLGHTLTPAVPSLFTFKIDDERLKDLQGLSVANVSCAIPGSKLEASGPMLITHWGVSGPGILRLSAWGARELAAKDYRFDLTINWLPEADVPSILQEQRDSSGKRRIAKWCPFEPLPKRLWRRLLESANISEDQTWSQLTNPHFKALVNQLTNTLLCVDGKSLNKEEFVTCGGVHLKDIDLRTMQSKICPGLHFAGEVMDIDGITGGFNFQNAWTSGYLAGVAIAKRD